MSQNRIRRAILGLLALLSMAIPHLGWADAFPSKAVRFIVPFPPGGTNDTLARLLGPRLTEIWSQPVVVENRAGASGAIGTGIAATSSADGYTMLMTSDTHVITPLLSKTPYDPISDFAPVAVVATSEIVLAVNPGIQATDLRSFIDLLKSNPGKLNFASPGNGNSLHLIGEQFLALTGTKMTHVPYKGAGPAITDLISGQVQAFFSPTINVAQHVKSGRLRALAVSGPKRLSSLPDVPTFTEAGLSGFDVRIWQGVLVPAGTPQDVVAKLADSFKRVLDDRSVREDLSGRGMDPGFTGPQGFAALLKNDAAKYQKIINDARITID